MLLKYEIKKSLQWHFNCICVSANDAYVHQGQRHALSQHFRLLCKGNSFE